MNTFEITIQRKEGDSWPIVAEYSHPDTLLPLRSEGRLQLSQEDFQELTSLLGGPKQYGRKLGRALFQEDVRDAFVRAVYDSEEPLRVLLFIEASDLQLRTLRWERLCAPIENDWRQLATNQRALFSLYIPSITERRFQPMGRRDLRALVLVASPESLGRYQLAPFDVEAAISGVRQALGEIKCDVLANVAGAIGMPTLDELCKQLTNREKRYSLLHFVCHGRVIDGGETVLYWANADNQVEPVKGTRLLERLSSLNGPKGLPHFAFLCSCETASPEAEGALGGLGQRLVRNLGMPAVVAMTEPVSVKTALALGESFYRQLTQSGEVDLALREATAGLAERDDITVPALFSRLGGRPLFSDQGYRDLTNSEIQFGLSRLETLLSERAPILSNKFDQQKTVLEETLRAEATALSNQARQERKKALEEVNNLCDRVLDLSFAALALDKEPPAYDSRCPFRGLQSFRPEDREFFFGREALIEKLQQKLAEHNFLAVLGTSGSGKSSVVLAGLIPAVQKNQPDLQMTYMTPNSEPLVQLNASLLKVHNQPSVLVVDQFEELFTLCTDEAKRVEFINQLLTLAQQQKVVVTMRADFWGECAKYHKLKELMQRRQELMGPMDSAELRRAMEMQAAKVGLRFEADLSNTILDDVQGEPGAMPLLQHALQEMWKRRHGRWLRCQEYRAIGGVQQAIAQTADNFYEKLSSQEKKQVRNIFVRLTRLDEDAVQGEKRRDTRQRVSLEDLVPAGGESVVTKKLVQRLADDRLIITSVNKVTDKEEVEVAHEALIRYWPKLQKWLDEDLVSIRLCKTISQAAHEWDKNRRDDNFLVHQGGRLEDADTLRKQSRLPLSQLEREYVDACVERRDRLFKEKEARNLVFVVNDLLKKDLTKALRMAQVAYCLDSSHTLPQVSQALSTAYYSVIASRSGLYVANQPHKDAVITAIYAPDSQKILTACKDGTAKLWDSRGKFLKAMEQGAQITSASFSHDGSKIVTVGYDHLVKMWDGEGNYIKDLVGHESDSMGHSDVKSVAFSPDDQTIVTVSVDHKVIMWDGQGNKKKELNDHEDPVGYVTFSPNGEYFVTCGLWRDSTAKLYDKDGNLIASLGMDTGESKKLNSWEWGITSAAFSLDNQFLVTTSHDFTAKMWDINGNHLKTLEEHQADVNQVVFSPDGNLFITVSDDKTAIIWDRQGNKCEILKGHEDSINSVAFSPDGNLVVTGGADCGAKLWHLNGNVLVNFRGHSSSINSVAFSPDGQYIVTASTDRTSKIWKVQPTIHTPHFDHDDEVIAAKFTPDGSKILTASNDLTVKLWDVKTNQLLKIYEGFDCDDYGNSRIYSLDVSPDGQRFITTGTDYTIRIWDIESGEIVQSWDGGHRYSCTPNGWCGATNARYSPDGKYIITCDFGGRVKLWDNEGNCAKELKGPDEPESHKMEVNGIDISKDNKYIATPGTEEKVVRLWDFQTGELLREFKGHSAAVNQVIFAHDGQSLLTASEDQTAKLWDLQGNILLNIEGHADTVRTAAFSPTGEYIITASHDRTAKIWNRQGKLVNTLTGHSEYLRSAYFSPDGQTVVTASEDRTAQVWSLAESIYSQLCNLDANIYHLTAADMEEYGIDVPLPYL
jgi:WD40 repeat protein/energy-coupling factor transporter ATP-binding protein EcfA2